MKKLRIAMVGLGDIAQKAYLPVVTKHSRIEPVFCTRNQQTLSQLQRQYRVNEGYTDFTELLGSNPDGVMIHSATSSHYSLALKSLEAGIATFIDKPVSLSITETEALVELANTRNVPLFVGFNRRYAPLVKPFASTKAIHIRWQKNRVALPANVAEFIYDDFIHLVDGLRFLAGLKPGENPADLSVTPFFQQDKLASIHVLFNHENAVVEGSMNRLSGITEEQLEVFLPEQKYHLTSLSQGVHYVSGQQTSLGFSDWESNLATRGFDAMVNDWILEVDSAKANNDRLKDIVASHRLCEQIIAQINLSCQQKATN